MGTDSRLDSSVNSSDVFPAYFKSYRNDHQRGFQGVGVFIHVVDYLSELMAEGDSEVVWGKIKVKGVKYLYVGGIYKPPSKTEPEYLVLLETCLTRIPRGAHLWLGGDFNLADIDWVNECPGHTHEAVPATHINL